MIHYEDQVRKQVKKGLLPREVFSRFDHAFIALDTTKDLSLFDIKRLKSNANRQWYRLRKGKYRAIFYIENKNYYVVVIAKREEVYDLWE